MEYVSVTILLLISLAIFVVFYVFIKARGVRLSPKDNKFISDRWNKISNRVKSNPNEAILEADKLLSYTLKLKGYHGSVGDQLKKSAHNFTNLDGVWSVHKLRNRIAHEMDVKLNAKQAMRAMKQFKKAIEDLGGQL